MAKDGAKKEAELDKKVDDTDKADDTQDKPPPPENKDNYWLAILYMNLFVIAHKG